METKFFLLVGIETLIFIGLSIFVNQYLHKRLTNKNLSFLTPIFNIAILFFIVNALQTSLNKMITNETYSIISDMCSKLSTYLNAVALILGIVFFIQFIFSLIRFFKNKKEEELNMTVALPMFKAGIDISKKNEKEYPLPSSQRNESKEMEIPKIASQN